MINKDGGRTAVMRREIELMGSLSPPTRETLVADIHLKIASNGHAHKLYQPKWVKEFRQGNHLKSKQHQFHILYWFICLDI